MLRLKQKLKLRWSMPICAGMKLVRVFERLFATLLLAGAVVFGAVSRVHCRAYDGRDRERNNGRFDFRFCGAESENGDRASLFAADSRNR